MRTFLFALSLLVNTVAHADFPLVTDPVINATPPGANVSAGYFTLVNESNDAITITGASSDSIPKIELHLSSVENDVAKMVKQESVTIDAGATLEFKHGGYHLMLMGLTEPLKENESVDIVLTTSQGDMTITMPIKKMGHGKAMHHSNGEHKSGEMNMNDTGDHASSSNHDMKNDDNEPTEPTKVVH